MMKNKNIFQLFFSLFLPKEGKPMRTNRYFFYACLCIVLLFFGMIGYMVRFMLVDSERVIANPYNKRTENLKEQIIRGRILSADGKILAETKKEEGEERRVYPYGREFAHVVGYADHGQSGLESIFNYALLTSHTDLTTQLANGINQQKNPGDDLVTTLDPELQEAAYDALDDYRGAVVAIEPSTGKIRAMVSKPDYDPNTLSDIWEDIINDETSSVLLNRNTQGLYPPGSTYKCITALEYIREHLHSYHDFHYKCKGETIVNNVKIHCYKEAEHGKETLDEAFAHSCNTAFVTLGCDLDRKQFIELNELLFFNRKISSDLSITRSRFKITEDSDPSELPQTVIGQGNTLMSPLHNALIMCCIANNGVMMRPMLAEKIQARDGVTVRAFKPEELVSLDDKEALSALNKMLRQVVTDGTATELQSDHYMAAGKTGTAENEKKNPHAWFVGYAGKKKPELVVCVIAENTGAGSTYAVPIAGKVFDAWYEGKYNEE